jgi:hypothetical protein
MTPFPIYFLAFDVLDTATGMFLATDRRHALLAGLPVVSAPLLEVGRLASLSALQALLGPSRCKTAAWRERLGDACRILGLDPLRVQQETDRSDTMEGLYIKVEEDGHVIGRYKFVRAGFLTAMHQAGDHWLDRPIIPNQLREGVDLFGGVP